MWSWMLLRSVVLSSLLLASCARGLLLTPEPRGQAGLAPSASSEAPREGTAAERWDAIDKHTPTDPPPDVLAVPGEYEPVDRVLLGWHAGNWGYVSYFGEVLRAIQGDARALIAVESETDQILLSEALSAEGVDPTRIDYVVHELDSMWIRDYGPLLVRTRSGLRVIDLPYHADRERDDVYPVRFAAREQLPVSRPPLEMEGGHIQSDGAGRCIVTDDVLSMNAAYDYDEQDVRTLLRAYFGCREVAIVPALVGEETGHVDVFAYVTGPAQVVVGAYELEQDAINARRLNRAAGILRGAGWDVRRIHMPGNAGRTVFRTHTNVVVTDHTVLVPIYRRDRRYERHALRVFERSFPGRRIVPIHADAVMSLAGAIHCTVIAIPSTTRTRG